MLFLKLTQIQRSSDSGNIKKTLEKQILIKFCDFCQAFPGFPLSLSKNWNFKLAK